MNDETMPPVGFEASDETEIKRSRFLATIARTDDEASARALVARLRAEHPTARHCCHAHVLDLDGHRIAHSSDDGEPAGTAGIPILNALNGAGLVNATAVVVRYFGGVKLGAGGLVRAYGGAVASLAGRVPRVVRQHRTVWRLETTHAEAGRAQEEVMRHGGEIVSTDYEADGVVLRFTGVGVAGEDPGSFLAPLLRGSGSIRADGAKEIEVSVEPMS
ncbi:MAG: YigZ family protein [Propionibacteriaceae bacterium]|jgi:uncharacterized YigZ family protein|nr:YigZ family protein [Propionibacteriaceae bacterium]